MVGGCRLQRHGRTPRRRAARGSRLGQRDGGMSAREVRRQTRNESRPVVGQASDQAIRTSRAGVAAGHRRTHQLQGIRRPKHRLACGAESLRSHDHNRGGTNSASQPQASQHEPYRLLSLNSLGCPVATPADIANAEHNLIVTQHTDRLLPFGAALNGRRPQPTTVAVPVTTWSIRRCGPPWSPFSAARAARLDVPLRGRGQIFVYRTDADTPLANSGRNSLD